MKLKKESTMVITVKQGKVEKELMVYEGKQTVIQKASRVKGKSERQVIKSRKKV